nr:hypothetical protein [Mycobacterium sp. UM_NZ2]
MTADLMEMAGTTNPAADKGPIPLRFGTYGPHEKAAKELAGGVGWHDSQPWIPPIKVVIDYPVNKNRQTCIPFMFDWSPFMPKRKAKQPKPWPQPAIPNPEGHKLPDGSVINSMSFDEKPSLDSAPIDVQAKAGYANGSNDLAVLATADKKCLYRTDDLGRSYIEGDGPGDYWRAVDRDHRKAKIPKAADASQPPTPLTDSLAGLRGRRCRNCLGRIPEDVHGKTRHCSVRCRDRGKYVRRHGQSGCVSPGIELASYSVAGRRFGIDTGDLGFCRLLTG